MLIKLYNKRNTWIASFDILPEEIIKYSEASILIYNNVHYVYEVTRGKFFSDVAFVEVNAPVEIK